MSSDLFEQERLSDLQRATQTYRDARENYQRLVRAALREQDTQKRNDLYNAISTENGRLIGVVESLMTAWSQGKLRTDEAAQREVVDLDKELEEFKQNIADMQSKQDSIVQLSNVLSSITGDTNTTKNYYYGYIVAVLVLLVIVFVLFVFSYIKTTVSSAITSVTPTEGVA
jgi:multidrug efflux pump subunit AcrB